MIAISRGLPLSCRNDAESTITSLNAEVRALQGKLSGESAAKKTAENAVEAQTQSNALLTAQLGTAKQQVKDKLDLHAGGDEPGDEELRDWMEMALARESEVAALSAELEVVSARRNHHAAESEATAEEHAKVVAECHNWREAAQKYERENSKMSRLIEAATKATANAPNVDQHASLLQSKLALEAEVKEQREVIVGLQVRLEAGAVSKVALQKVVVDKTVDVPSMPTEEAAELVTLLETKEEALELCQESGIVIHGSVSMKTMQALLKGHLQHTKPGMKQAFEQLDSDGSGYLDEEEVQQAVALLGFVANESQTSSLMAEMDPDGDGRVTLMEFSAWWDANVGPETSAVDQKELERLRADTERLSSSNKRLETRCQNLMSQIASGAYDKSDGSKVALQKVVVDKTVDVPSMPTEEAAELVTLLETKEEALELCQESGIVIHGSVSMKTMQALLKGHLQHTKPGMKQAFEQLDSDGSGYLDEEEVQQAVALLGFVANESQTSSLMAEMDPDGDGRVTLMEFSAWWDGNMTAGDPQSANQKLHRDFEKLRQKHEELKKSTKVVNHRHKATVSSLSEEVGSLKEKAKTAQSAQTDAAKVAARLQDSLDRADSQLSDHKQECESLHAEKATWEEERVQSSKSIASLTAVCQTVTNQLEEQLSSEGGSDQGEELQRWKASALKHETEVSKLAAELKDTVAHSESQTSALSQNLEELQASKAKLDLDVDGYRQTVAALTAECNVFKGQLELRQAESAKASSGLLDAVVLAERQAAQTIEATQERDELLSDKEVLELEAEEHQMSIAALTAQVETINKQLQEQLDDSVVDDDGDGELLRWKEQALKQEAAAAALSSELKGAVAKSKRQAAVITETAEVLSALRAELAFNHVPKGDFDSRLGNLFDEIDINGDESVSYLEFIKCVCVRWPLCLYFTVSTLGALCQQVVEEE